eukprot:NODE_2_length_91304_cov_0.692462.p63 type:complete len:165 gc:universal NODE_2_length_91304_cov_0.692462:5772-5278(-)
MVHFLSPLYRVPLQAPEKDEEKYRLLLESDSVINIRSINNDFYLNALHDKSFENFYVVFYTIVNRMSKYSKFSLNTSDTHTTQKGSFAETSIYTHLDSLEKKMYDDFNFTLNQYYKLEFGALNPFSSSYCGYSDQNWFVGWRPHQTFLRKASSPSSNKKKKKSL